MKKKITLTDDHIKLIPFLLLEENDDDVVINKKVCLSMQSHVLDDVSLILGLRDKAIPNTSEDADGMAFPDEIEEYMLDVYRYVTSNLLLIEEIIHQFVTRGGITAGTYERDEQSLWTKI